MHRAGLSQSNTNINMGVLIGRAEISGFSEKYQFRKKMFWQVNFKLSIMLFYAMPQKLTVLVI